MHELTRRVSLFLTSSCPVTAVRAVQHWLQLLKEPCGLPLEEQRLGFDHLGDLCTGLGMHRVALRHYKRAVSRRWQSYCSHLTTT